MQKAPTPSKKKKKRDSTIIQSKLVFSLYLHEVFLSQIRSKKQGPIYHCKPVRFNFYGPFMRAKSRKDQLHRKRNSPWFSQNWSIIYACTRHLPNKMMPSITHNYWKSKFQPKKKKKKKSENYPTIMHYFNMLKAKVQIHI